MASHPRAWARGPMDNPGVQCSVWKLLEKKPEEVPPLKDVRDRVEVEYESWVGMDRAKKGGEAFEKAMDEFCDAKIGDAVPKAAESQDQAIATATEKLRQEVATSRRGSRTLPRRKRPGRGREAGAAGPDPRHRGKRTHQGRSRSAESAKSVPR